MVVDGFENVMRDFAYFFFLPMYTFSTSKYCVLVQAHSMQGSIMSTLLQHYLAIIFLESIIHLYNDAIISYTV